MERNELARDDRSRAPDFAAYTKVFALSLFASVLADKISSPSSVSAMHFSVLPTRLSDTRYVGAPAHLYEALLSEIKTRMSQVLGSSVTTHEFDRSLTRRFR